jgi:putative spermidine/putrescine transport system ATP-binding protein
MTVHLKVEDLQVRLGHNEVLRGISFDVEPGEFITLLGPSGSGKTTILNVIAGFVRQNDGHVLFDDAVVDDVPPLKRGIGIVFQNYAIFPNMNVLENVAFPLRARQVPRRERERLAEEYLELVQLGGMGRRQISTLSGGQRQRVALARALVFKPALLLLDEPLGALDKKLRESMQHELKRIQREVGVTTISVTHDQVESLTMSDRVGIIDAGLLRQYAAPEAIYQKPASDFIAQFLGEANLLAIDTGGLVSGIGVTMAGARGGTAVVRPENLSIVDLEDSRVRSVKCTVLEKDFQGSRYRLVVQTNEGHEQLVVSVPPGLTGQSVQRGDTVAITCNLSEIHTINPE